MVKGGVSIFTKLCTGRQIHGAREQWQSKPGCSGRDGGGLAGSSAHLSEAASSLWAQTMGMCNTWKIKIASLPSYA